MQLLNEHGPITAHAIVVGVGGQIYVHGGTKKRNDLQPVAMLQRFDFETDKWMDLSSSKCPPLSHHATFVTEDRFINLVGGWDGKSRTHDVQVFDTRHEKWLDNCRSENFPVGAGLSSHSVSPLVSGDALVIGRLGGLRTQRKSSSVLLCKRVDCTRFTWSELPLNVASRSGHSCNAISNFSVAIIGGRDDKNGSNSETLLINQPLLPENKLLEYDQLTLKASSNWPCRKYHSALLLNDDKIFVYGGESTVGAINAEPLNDSWIYSLKKNKWYECQNLSFPKLAGHKTVQLFQKWFVFGGFTDKFRVNRTLYELRL